MKQLAILSGKGGTGKTTVAGAFIKLAEARAYADCDVDAPNLHLIMKQPSEPERAAYYGLPKAAIGSGSCTRCGLCAKYCRFGAISSAAGYRMDPFACEGCGVCAAVCPAGAIAMIPSAAGELALYSGSDSVFSTAKLKTGSGTTGKLVSEVKSRMNNAARDACLAIIDGSPGIGCPVIASMSGADFVLIVAEPSISGISDMARILRTAGIFQTRASVCVNKYDTNPAIAAQIEALCREQAIPFAGHIPYDPDAVKATNSGRTVVDMDCAAGLAVREVFQRTMKLLFPKS